MVERTPGMALLALASIALGSCSSEARVLAADQPQTPPSRADDPRASRYEDNVYQVAQGGRYFGWYGCSRCHGPEASGVLDLGDENWRHGGAVDQVYGFIAHAHGARLPDYNARIPVEQLWQLTAYVRSLPSEDPAKRRREATDFRAEPQADRWSGPLR